MGGTIFQSYEIPYTYERDSIVYSTSKTLPARRIAQYRQLKNKFNEFQTSAHGIKRWRERVGPADDLHYINHLFKYFYETGRVTIENEFENLGGLIDDDIIYFFEPSEEKTLVLTTFYGRISDNLVLRNFKYLMKYVKHTGEKANLALSNPVPKLAIPTDVCIMSYHENELAFEKYNSESGFLYNLTFYEEGREVFSGILESGSNWDIKLPDQMINQLKYNRKQYLIASDLLGFISGKKNDIVKKAPSIPASGMSNDELLGALRLRFSKIK